MLKELVQSSRKLASKIEIGPSWRLNTQSCNEPLLDRQVKLSLPSQSQILADLLKIILNQKKAVSKLLIGGIPKLGAFLRHKEKRKIN